MNRVISGWVNKRQSNCTFRLNRVISGWVNKRQSDCTFRLEKGRVSRAAMLGAHAHACARARTKLKPANDQLPKVRRCRIALLVTADVSRPFVNP